MKSIMKSIVIKASGPLGPSKLGRGFGTDWNNQHCGTDGPVTCEICGTKHEQDTDSGYTISVFLGKTVVEKCCGVIFDQIYREIGEEFAQTYLEEFSENPTALKFSFFPRFLSEILSETQNKISQVGSQIQEAKEKVAKIME